MKTTAADIKTQLIEVIERQVLGFDPVQPLKDQLDSLALLAVLTQIEKSFGVRFYTVEISTNDWTDLDSLAAVILKKKSAR